ncbi:hypothetical protein HETIRDRAFT_320089 [Heterobasidion irregulare TC 32-1]|uniref:Uncharacterized protein n=1 Tax=Heterobasidion irregulare (strain TC 32-1) TaxID=747525 RepID=W4K3S7_HETIT|nr:uncharacterized protein HETIRDRAFT_320089 [Heterobasidion irregulare TC 32-1]ETW80488.1 hypothetical protein HETIRDRAFT_320089 [Heterobasidion irregulare TC 32-1]
MFDSCAQQHRADLKPQEDAGERLGTSPDRRTNSRIDGPQVPDVKLRRAVGSTGD